MGEFSCLQENELNEACDDETEGEKKLGFTAIFMQYRNYSRISPSVKIFDFATSLVRGRYFLIVKIRLSISRQAESLVILTYLLSLIAVCAAIHKRGKLVCVAVKIDIALYMFRIKNVTTFNILIAISLCGQVIGITQYIQVTINRNR